MKRRTWPRMIVGVALLGLAGAGVVKAAPAAGARAAALPPRAPTSQAAHPDLDNVTNVRLEVRAEGSPADVASAAELQEGVVWLGWRVDGSQDEDVSCCFSETAAGEKRCGCVLERSSGRNDFSSSDTAELEATGAVRVLVRVADGEITEIRSLGESCPIDGGNARLVWLRDVPTVRSVNWLATVVSGEGVRADVRQEGVAAVAMHAGPESLGRLHEWTTSAAPTDRVQEQAIFWLGAARGAEGWPRIEELVTSGPEPNVRERAVFAAFVSKQPGAADVLLAAARDDASSQVRRSALMWVAQLAGERAIPTLRAAMEEDPDTEVKKQALFALSQLPPDRGVPMLIDIARSHDNPEVRRQALFWLGQTGDERALRYIEELLEGA